MKKTNLNIYVKLIAVAMASLFIVACSTKKNTFIHRGWHNMNARYNGYFYSRENVKETLVRVEKGAKDDFTRIIPLFVYTTNESAKGFYGDFDKTIKKSSTVIQRHTITDKHKVEIANACRWIDENYMLIGKAHFYKRDFFSALEAFEYVSKKYPNPEAKYGAMIWMIRTNNEIGSLSQSQIILDDLRNKTDLPQDRYFQRDLFAATADFYIKQEDYPQAIQNLTKAIALTRNKKVKARFTYVLAQLYEERGDNGKASMYYGMVPKLHPLSYDMEFNAQINRAKLYDVATGDPKVIKKQLNKMLKDAKNTEFQDQIYYTLADIAYREKDVPLTLTYLDKSIRVSTSNPTQKALSYLKRADIYFDHLDYKPAEANYDSTMSFLPKDYKDYKIISEKKKSLTALVVNLKVIALEDSLQALARLSEKDRNAAIDKIITDIEEQEKKQEEEKQNEQNNILLNTNNTTVTPGSTTNTGAWYFYNPSTVAFGTGEFTKKWGTRKLEDNWRRSQKEQTIALDENGEPVNDSAALTAGNAAASAAGAKNKKDRDYYLKSIPLTADALAKSNQKIVEAYYNVGSIYKEQLQNNPKSVEAFEELIKRYPENKYKLSTYYQLYRTYLTMNDQVNSDKYKDILLNKYPESEYADIIRNPGHSADIAAKKSVIEKFYAETYQLYTDGRYPEALINCNKADTLYAKSYLMPQFAFIKALCIGRTQDINAFESALTQIVIKYPKEPVKDKAQEMLDMIKKQKNPTTETASTDSTEAKPKFVFKEDGEYYWLVIVNNGKGDIAKFKTALSDVNTQSYSLFDLNVSSVFLDMTHQLVSVKTFDGKDKAMDYYNFMKNNKAVFKDLEEGTYQSFVISAENYTTFYKEKNIEEYKAFFTQNFK